MRPRSRRCVCRPADKAAPAPTAPQARARRLRTGKQHRITTKHENERPARGPALLACPESSRADPCAAVTWWSMPGTRPPMFPLSAVLFPHASMPLHVFEPRYRALMRDCLAGDARFGIVLIERGSEVGGGDERSALGTRGVITEAVELPDGRWVLEIEGEALIAGGGVAPRRPLPGGAGPRCRTGGRDRATPVRWWAPPGSGSAGPAPCWRSRVARRPSRPSSRSTAEGMSMGGLAAVRGRPAQRLRRPAAPGEGRRRGAIAAPGRVDGRSRARPAAHARALSRRAPVGPSGGARRASPAQWPPSRSYSRRLARRGDRREAEEPLGQQQVDDDGEVDDQGHDFERAHAVRELVDLERHERRGGDEGQVLGPALVEPEPTISAASRAAKASSRAPGCAGASAST